MLERRFFWLAAWCVLSAHAALAVEAAENWGQWRGPPGTGVAPHGDPPLRWNEADGTNIHWKTEIPGRGHSTPVVGGDRVFLTTAIAFGDPLPPRPSGRAITTTSPSPIATGSWPWRSTARAEKPLAENAARGRRTSRVISRAAWHPILRRPTASIFAFFGSFGLYCLSVEGELIWKADFGPMQSLHGHGEGSSPVLYQDTLIVNWDHEGSSFVVALDKRTGQERWKVKRNEVTSWATPIIVSHAGNTQVIVSGTSRVRGYDLANGKVLWECGGLSSNIVASPVAADGMVFAGSSYDKRALLAIRLDGAKGDITGSDRIAWSRIRARRTFRRRCFTTADSTY